MTKRQLITQKDALRILREIETGRGGIAELAQERPDIQEASQQRLGDEVVSLWRAILVLDELRPEAFVSTTLDLNVAFRIGCDFPVVLSRPETLDAQIALLRYDIEPDRVMAHVPFLVDACKNVLRPEQLQRAIRSPRTDELIPVQDIIEHAYGEQEVIADVTGLEPDVRMFERNMRGRDRMALFKDIALGRIDADAPREADLKNVWPESGKSLTEAFGEISRDAESFSIQAEIKSARPAFS